MSHTRLAATVESTIVFDPLVQEEFITKVARWKQLFLACYGPHGTQVMIQNTLGGHVSVTSSANQILNNIQASHPLLKVLVGSVKGHCKAYSDFGLFCALLGFNLISSPVTSELPVSLVAHIRNDIFEIVVEHLLSGCHYCKIKIDMQNLKQLLAVVTAILRTKTVCVLSSHELQFIATVVMQSFLSTVPSTPPSTDQQYKLGQTHFVTVEGMSPTHSRQFSGLLHPVVSAVAGNVCKLGTNRKVALFDTSLAGDTSEAPLAEFRLESSSLIEESVLSQLQNLGEELIRLEVDVLACQKVVHPCLINLLQKKGMLVLDRLGQETFALFCSVTGGTPVSSIFCNISEKELGCVDVEEVTIYWKYYLRFTKPNITVSSILLCHVQEECVAELQKACQQSLLSLKWLLSSSETFVGAGCLETHLAKVIQQEIIKRTQAGTVCPTIAQVQVVTDDLTKALITLGKNLHPNRDKFHTDAEFGHLWTQRSNMDGMDEKCACGLVTSEMLNGNLIELEFKPPTTSVIPSETSVNELSFLEGSIIDVAIPKFAAYKCAFEISLLLLKVGLIIADGN